MSGKVRKHYPRSCQHTRQNHQQKLTSSITVWAYQAFYGLFVCPWYSYSQIMISEVTPRGKEFLFFSLFSIIGKASSFIGPLVSSAIIDASASKNNSTPFYFLFALSLASFLFLLFFVDLGKSRVEQEEFLEREREAKKRIAGGSDGGDGESGIGRGL